MMYFSSHKPLASPTSKPVSSHFIEDLSTSPRTNTELKTNKSIIWISMLLLACQHGGHVHQELQGGSLWIFSIPSWCMWDLQTWWGQSSAPPCSQVMKIVSYGLLPDSIQLFPTILSWNLYRHKVRYVTLSREIFGHNRSRCYCFQVQPVTCWRLLVFSSLI